MKRYLNDLKRSTIIVVDNFKILIIPYLFYIVTEAIGTFITSRYTLPNVDPATINSSAKLIILIPILLAVTGLIASTSVHFQLANLFEDSRAKTFEGSKQYFWRFFGYYLILSLFLIVLFAIFFGYNYSVIYENKIVNIIFSFIIICFTTFCHVSMVVANNSPLAAMKDVIHFIITKFSRIAIPTLIALTCYQIATNLSSYFTSAKSNIFILIVIGFISSCFTIWLKSCFTLIYKNNLSHPLVLKG